MYTLYKDRWILDENGVAIAQRCRGTTNVQWFLFVRYLADNGRLKLTTEQLLDFYS